MTDEQKLLFLENIVNTATKVVDAINRGQFGEAVLLTRESERKSMAILSGVEEIGDK